MQIPPITVVQMGKQNQQDILFEPKKQSIFVWR